MKIGIIVHSKSGHTFNVAQKLAAKCTEKKLNTDVFRLKAEGKIVPHAKKITISDPPAIGSFDVLIFGGPVWAFDASPVIAAYLRSIGNCKGKKIICFVTMGFPFAFLGGNQALTTINKLLDKSGANILPGEIINRSSLINTSKLESIVDKIVKKIIQ